MRYADPMLWLVSVAFASSQPLTRAQVCARADAVVIGEVTGQEAAWRPDGGIETLVDVTVEAVQRGRAPGDLRITVAGGTVAGVRMEVSEAPRFVNDQRYLLLLVRREAGWEALGLDGVIPIRRPDGQGRGEPAAEALASLGVCR